MANKTIKKVTPAQIRATTEYEKEAYFKTLVRFPKELEDDIRQAAKKSGRSLNNFLVSSACTMAGIPEPELKEPGGGKK